MEENRIIYADHAATTPVLPEVRDAMLPFFAERYGNPSSLHGDGLAARDAVEQGREEAASLIGASAEELFFTSSGTESSNTVLKGCAFAAMTGERRRILVSAVEHPSVLAAADALVPFGFAVERIPVDENGVVSLGVLAERIGADCLLVSVMHANNETGVIQPVKECARIAHGAGALFHTDAVQTVGHIPVDVGELDCDLLSFSGHKLGAPKGIGGLYVRKGTPVTPLLHGGSQERGMRSGTENVPYIVGLGAACLAAAEYLRSGEAAGTAALRDSVEGRLRSLGGCRVNGGGVPRVPGTLNLSFDGIGGESLMLMCDLYGLRISTGSACGMGKGDGISHVLRAMHLPDDVCGGTVRVSIGAGFTASDADAAVEIMSRCVEMLRDAAGKR